MREIKFRYWCTIEKKMYDKAYVEEHLELAFMSELIDVAQNRYVFQQYTGLDNIYEGDIVYGEELGEYGTVLSSWYGLVYWDTERCGFYVKDDLEIFRLDDYDFSKVIGNKFENPNLLEVNQ